MNASRALKYARANRSRFVSELKQFLRFPSVSSEVNRKSNIEACARWLAANLKASGLDRVRIIPTRGNPIIYASWQHAGNRPTLIFYGHYDVLPGEPLSQWRSPPFTPTIQGNDIHGRGSSDDKGQLFCHIKALESFLRSSRALPVNVKCIFEGEEEIGSTNLLPFVQRNKRALRADAAIISDTKMLGLGRPAISYAQRGGLRAELEIRGPQTELHSGTFGGAVHNPIQALAEIIADLHDENGRVTIAGFYDDVAELDDKERAYMARVGPSDEKLLRDATVDQTWGESGFSQYERTTIRPALTLNGITGGHTGPGAKGIIPTQAIAKLSFRLVPNQDPKKIAQLFRDHIAQITPPTVQANLRISSPAQPALIDRKHPAVRTAALAYQKGFGALPVFLRSGGSIPVLNTFQEILGIPAVLMGFGLPDDRIHAPNEKFHLPNFFRGIDTSIWYMAAAASRLHKGDRTRSKIRANHGRREKLPAHYNGNGASPE